MLHPPMYLSYKTIFNEINIGTLVTTLYGIKNCDTVKKARKWLEANHIDYTFHDVRLDGLTLDQLTNWAEQVGWEKLLNKRSTTWKQLDEQLRSNINRATALETMLASPTLIKRPLLETDQTTLVGFNTDLYQAQFGI